MKERTLDVVSQVLLPWLGNLSIVISGFERLVGSAVHYSLELGFLAGLFVSRTWHAVCEGIGCAPTIPMRPFLCIKGFG